MLKDLELSKDVWRDLLQGYKTNPEDCKAYVFDIL